MSGNFWDEVYTAAPLGDLDRCDMTAVFHWLSRHFPVSGTKIDWSRVRGRHAHWQVTDDVQLASTAITEVRKRIRHGSVAQHVGDGLSPYGIYFTGDDAPSVLPALIEIPEHHYFLAEDRSWIVVVTTEGDIDAVDNLDLEKD
ncbi:MAG: hypothetical protein ACRDT6_18780 [Micromonosporaceae bacterium]